MLIKRYVKVNYKITIENKCNFKTCDTEQLMKNGFEMDYFV